VVEPDVNNFERSNNWEGNPSTGSDIGRGGLIPGMDTRFSGLCSTHFGVVGSVDPGSPGCTRGYCC